MKITQINLIKMTVRIKKMIKQIKNNNTTNKA